MICNIVTVLLTMYPMLMMRIAVHITVHIFFSKVLASNIVDEEEQDDTIDHDENVEPELDDEDEDGITQPEKKKKDEATASGSACQVSSTKGSYKFRSHHKNNVEKENKPSAFELDLMKVLKGKDKDSDELFAASVAESLKTLHGQTKAMAKVKIQQVLLEAEFPATLPVVSNVMSNVMPNVMPEYRPSNDICSIPCNQSYSHSGGEGLAATPISRPSTAMYEMGGY